MIKKINKYVILTILVMILSIVTESGNNIKAATIAESTNNYNENIANSIDEENLIGLGTIQLDSSINTLDSVQSVSTYAIGKNGNISGDGVRLRKKPKSTATILELMYNLEVVCIDYTESAKKSNGKWYYVKRVKTGTWGWVNYKYLCHWD